MDLHCEPSALDPGSDAAESGSGACPGSHAPPCLFDVADFEALASYAGIPPRDPGPSARPRTARTG